MFCFKCGASMPDDSKTCPKCATPVEAMPAVGTPQTGATPTPSTPSSPGSAWLNAPPAQGQYPGQAQPYPRQVQPYQQTPQTDGKAVASLILGILSPFCLFALTGIPAVILGHLSRSTIEKSRGRMQGGGMALAGLILGYIGIGFSLLVIPAIMIPNLMRARISANESQAANTVRTIDVSQMTYSTTYPDKGYAQSLAVLGPGASGQCSQASADNACLIDNTLGNASCTSGAWCTKSAYRYSIRSACTTEEGACKEYVIVATPVNPAAATKSFCSTSDAIVRYRFGMMPTPPSAEDCARWSPI